jgi:translation initiation factor 4A
MIIGTPGKIKGMIQKGLIDMHQIKILIIDEADEMLSLGFIEQINEIIGSIDPTTQVCFFSATMPDQVLKITEQALSKPVKILVKSENVTLEGISQYYMSCESEDSKINALVKIFKEASISQCFIYFNSKEWCAKYGETLQKSNIPCEFIHGGLDMDQRNEIMKKFRSGEIKYLLTTDLLARGIDVTQCGLVINCEFPSSMENYIHWIGRSGRFGRRGVAINLIT